MFANIRDPSERLRLMSRYAGEVDVSPSVHPRMYFRSGKEMIRMANVYLDEGNLESSYILYMKFITLFVERLPAHPDYKLADSAEKTQNKKKLKDVFALAETIKGKLKTRYTEEEDKKKAEELAREEELARAAEKHRKEEEEAEFKKLQADEERKHNEEAKRQQEQEEEYHLLQEMERIRIQEETERKHKQELEDADLAAAIAASTGILPASSTAPPAYGEACPHGPPVPSRDLKPSAPVTPTAPSVPLTPPVDRTNKPAGHFMSTGESTTNKYGLRDVVVPSELIVKFLNLALPNTNMSIETCGILCGKLAQGQLRITHLLIPKQSGTADSCTAEGEADIFDYQDKYELITLGWIHTHPTQTAFLSSVDMHNHYGYQVMMPEALAIVCSPKYHETGYFTLTPEHGMKEMGTCRQTGFHHHAKDPPLFEESSHYRIDPAASVTLLDLR